MKHEITSTDVVMSHKVFKGRLGFAAAFLLIGGIALDANAAVKDIEHETDDGITWRLYYDTESMTVQLGKDATTAANEKTRGAVISGMPNSLAVPSSFTIGGKNYVVTRVASRAFARAHHGGTLCNITFPLDRDITFGANVFNYASALQNILFKGPSCVVSGGAQTYTTLTLPDLVLASSEDFYGQSIVINCSKLKNVIVGPNVKVDDVNKLNGFFEHDSNGAVLFVPRNEGNMSWNGSHEVSLGGENNSVVYYGPSEAFDMEMYDTYATFIPNTEAGLTQVLGLAQTFKTAFNLDVRIAIKKRINMTAEVTESMLQSVTLVGAPPWYITFAVRTQAQLDYVLSVVQADIPVIIDMDGATEDIVVPEGRQVAILAKGGWTFGKKHKGLIIQFK